MIFSTKFITYIDTIFLVGAEKLVDALQAHVCVQLARVVKLCPHGAV